MKSSFAHKFILLLCFFIISLSVSAQFEKGMKEYKGMRYKIQQIGKGEVLTDSSILHIQMKVFNSADSLLRDTDTEDFPPIIDLREEETRKIPLVEIIRKGKIGDNFTIFIHADSIFLDESSYPPFILKGSWIREELKLMKSYIPEEYEEEKIKMQQEFTEKMEIKVREIQRQSDSISKAQVKYIENTYFVEKRITNYQKTESGLFYVVEKQGTKIKEGERISANYKGTLLISGEKFDSSYDREDPFEFTIGQGQAIKGWDEGIPLIGRGGKGILYIPSNLAYGAQQAGSIILPHSMLIFEVEVLDEYFDANVNQYDDEEMEEIETSEEQQTTSQKDPNTYYIDDNQEDYIENVYLKLNEITDYKKTASGLFYRIEKQGTPITKGEQLKIRYEETFLMTGENLDSSHDSEKIYEITIGERNFIKGWEEGIPIIGKGGIGYLYIPSKLAYGKEEVGEQLEPDAMLIYKIEILEN